MITPDPVEKPALTATPALPWMDGQSGVIALRRGVTVEQVLNGALQFTTNKGYPLSCNLGQVIGTERVIILTLPPYYDDVYYIDLWEGLSKSLTIHAFGDEGTIKDVTINEPLGFLQEALGYTEHDIDGEKLVLRGDMVSIKEDGSDGDFHHVLFTQDGTNVLAGTRMDDEGFSICLKEAGGEPLSENTVLSAVSADAVNMGDIPKINCYIGRDENTLEWFLNFNYGPGDFYRVALFTPSGDNISINNYTGAVCVREV